MEGGGANFLGEVGDYIYIVTYFGVSFNFCRHTLLSTKICPRPGHHSHLSLVLVGGCGETYTLLLILEFHLIFCRPDFFRAKYMEGPVTIVTSVGRPCPPSHLYIIRFGHISHLLLGVCAGHHSIIVTYLRCFNSVIF